MFLSYNPTNKTMTGLGNCKITLANLSNTYSSQLSNSTGDLYILGISSSLLANVPVLSGGITNVGSMRYADVQNIANTNANFTWDPILCPAISAPVPTTNMAINAYPITNLCYNIDTIALSPSNTPVQAAYMPTLDLSVSSTNYYGFPPVKMTFTSLFDTNQSQNYAIQNVSMTPLVKASINPNAECISLNFTITSAAPSFDGIGYNFNVTGTGAPSAQGEGASLDVRYTESLPATIANLHRSIGALPWVTNSPDGTVGIYGGPVEAVSMDGYPNLQGFLFLRQ